ncbi:EF-hand domain-containing protein [Amycolatopsis sp. H20-H5]|uniref:EF-hand domain-containing protein n=1 Tax=Amycolatopsis sp. H20-H5 TaxID=3046309 RepID=UPI002DBB01C4|nr:EF-hand domain-containing protein [Amycolatopsis sp. H20-H5]MEC3974506.1 EF-hand domain-containing protein [Amycolatopsis sp. H20-H5]
MTTTVSHDLYYRKMDHVFDMLDVTKDAHLAEDDFAELAAGISAIVPGQHNQQKIAAFRDAMLGWFHALLLAQGLPMDGSMEREQFRAAMVKVILGEGRYVEVFEPVAVTWFRLYDADDSNSLSLEEFQVLSRALQISEADTEAGFCKFDFNGDGELSEEEFLTVARQFYAGEDPDAPGNWLYGPF